MNFAQAIKEAFESIFSNKLRSALTVLGIIIGVAAVIAMLSIGRGAQNSVTGSIEGIGHQEMILWNNQDLESLRSAIETAINTYYSVY